MNLDTLETTLIKIHPKTGKAEKFSPNTANIDKTIVRDKWGAYDLEKPYFR